MALPNRIGAAFVLLGNAEGTDQRSAGIIADFQDTGDGSPPAQKSFYSYSWFFDEYPGQAVVKTSAGVGVNYGYAKIVPAGSEYNYKYPKDIVTVYDPDPPLSQPVPDPNGEIGEEEGQAPSVVVSTPPYPRWFSDMPYDYSLIPLEWPGFVPTPDYLPGPIFINEGTMPAPGSGVWSWDVSVQNLESQVLNEATDEYEYYPLKQETSELKVTSKFKVVIDTVVCCWNKDVTVRGKVGFKAVDTTVEPLPNPATPDYNYGGISVEIGTNYTDAGEADWEVVISDDFVPAEIEIPKVSGRITFINDFWVTEIVQPS